MDKVYLLLRNNQEKGPFSFDELLQQKLQPLDLIWVEGRSESWSYPSELEELNHLFPSQNAKTSSVSVILPKQEIKPVADQKEEEITTNNYTNPPILSVKKDLERRAEDIKQRALNFEKNNQEQELDINIINDGVYKLKREIPLTYKTNKKFVSAPQLTIVAFISVLVIGWLYGDFSLIRSQTHETSAAVTTYTGNEQATEDNKAKETTTETIAPIVPGNEVDVLPSSINVNRPRHFAANNTIETSETVTEEPVVSEPQPAVQIQEQVEEKVQTPVVTSVKEEKAKVEERPAEEPDEVEKKKKGGFLKGLFRKKKKDDKRDEEVEVK